MLSKKDKLERNYKFRDVKVYCSTEWMAGGKKYRQVFDKMETTYIWVEFSFFNKLFDEEEWSTKINVKAFSLDNGKKTQLCDLDENLTIRMDENIVKYLNGWGNVNPGTYWFKGEYIWEGYIDGKLVGSRKFYIEDHGKVNIGNNPYFDIDSIKLFEGGYEGWKDTDRKYLKTFKKDNTKYIWAEIKLKSKISGDWQCELFFNFYDDAGQLKGHQTALNPLKDGNAGTVYTIERGWGSDKGDSWMDDSYSLEIIFMDTLIAVVPFKVGNKIVEGLAKVYTTGQYFFNKTGDDQNVNSFIIQDSDVATIEAEDKKTLEELLKGLEELIGLEKIKKQIRNHITYLDFIKIRKKKGFKDTEKFSLHSVFTGNPGTGKTTVVNMLGKIYKKMGLLSKGHVKVVDRADLVAEFIGQTAPKVKKQIEAARGGILFIDEAYNLYRPGTPNDFGPEVIEIIIKEISDGKGDLAIMVAGYPKEMENFLDSNPGLKSRFRYYFHFDDYTPEELSQIADHAAKKRTVELTKEAKEIINKELIEAYRNRTRTFGNARYVISIINEGKLNMGLRLMEKPNVDKLSKKTLSTIELQDVEKIFKTKRRKIIEIEVNEELLATSLEELNDLIGLGGIKEEINELVKLVRYYREIGKDIMNSFSLHTVFTGNPGTGKTTLARILAKIYKALGLLERGHTIECDREGLVAGYIGQTAIKTKEKIDKAQGGILFIDEAYALTQGGSQDFGKEAIEVLLKNMEDLRGKFGVIVAGYPDNMNEFLLSNPGLKSRFDKTLYFEDFVADELYEIAVMMFSKENLKLNKEASQHLKEYFNYLHSVRDKYFGNARKVRKVIEEATRNQNLRMASISSKSRTPKMLKTLTIDDVKVFDIGKEGKSPRKIGFIE